MEEQPFFIIGSGRCGTTVLRLMLNLHPRLRVPRESWFLIPLVDKLPTGQSLSDAEKEQAFEIISAHPRWKDWECDDAVLRRVIFDPEVTDLTALIDQVFLECCGMRGKVRWGDKTPKYSCYVRKLERVFPEAKFIHIFRDARDTCVSMRNGGWCDGDIRRVAKYWTGMTHDAMMGREFGPNRYLEMSYEALVHDPEKSLRAICAFLGEAYEPSMIGFHQTALQETAAWEDGLHAKTRQPVQTKEIGRWRKDLSRWEHWIVESYASQTMRALGQEPALGTWTAPFQWGLKTALEAKFQAKIIWGKVKARLGMRESSS